jgi:hypoxanthine phosphoribosyltransferase
MADLYVSWADYHRAIERLAAMVHGSGWQFNQIVCIARGGLRVGDIMSRIFELPLAIIFTSSYTGESGTTRGEITVSKHMAMTTSTLGDRVLVVDDLVDSGVTLEAVRHYIEAHHPNVAAMRTAVLWYKGCSKLKPDYFVEYLPDSPWIHQPFEAYDRMNPDEVASRVSQARSIGGAD